MKEINPSTVRLLRNLAGNAARLKKEVRLCHLVICVDIDNKEVDRLMREHDLGDLVVAVARSDGRDFRRWKLHTDAKSTLVLIDRMRILQTVANLEPREIPNLEARLKRWLGKKK